MLCLCTCQMPSTWYSSSFTIELERKAYLKFSTHYCTPDDPKRYKNISKTQAKWAWAYNNEIWLSSQVKKWTKNVKQLLVMLLLKMFYIANTKIKNRKLEWAKAITSSIMMRMKARNSTFCHRNFFSYAQSNLVNQKMLLSVFYSF